MVVHDFRLEVASSFECPSQHLEGVTVWLLDVTLSKTEKTVGDKIEYCNMVK